MTVGELLVLIKGDNSDLKSKLGESEKDAKSAFSGIGSAVAKVATIVAELGAVVKGVNYNASMESAKVAFGVMLGGASRAKDMIEGLRKLAVETPLEFKDVQEAGQTLLQFGVAANDIIPTVRMLGDVAMGNAEKMKAISVAFGQITSAGRLNGQDLLQLINAGYNPLNDIAKKTGESMSQLRKRMEAGGISAKEVSDAFKSATSEGGKFYNMMAQQTDTFAGTLSNLKDAFDVALGQGTEGAMDDIRRVMKDMITILQDPTVVANLKNMGDSIGVVVTVVGALAKALAWAGKNLDLTVIGGAALGSVFGPLGALIGAAAGAAASLAAQIIKLVNAPAKKRLEELTAASDAYRKSLDSLSVAQLLEARSAYENELAHTRSLSAIKIAEQRISDLSARLTELGYSEDEAGRKAKASAEEAAAAAKKQADAEQKAYDAVAERVREYWAQKQATSDWIAKQRDEELREMTDYTAEVIAQGEAERASRVAVAQAWVDSMSKIGSAVGPVLESIGTALVEQGDSWSGVGKSAIKAIAGIVRALGDELAAMAAKKLVEAIANTLDPLMLWAAPGQYAAAAGLGVGAAAAYVSAGAISAWADTLANGTSYARGGLTWVGERGPELVQLPRGAQVTNAASSAAAARSGLGGLTVQVYSPKATAAETARETRRMVERLAFEGKI